MPYIDMQRDSDGIQWVEKTVVGQLDFLFDWAGKEHGSWSEDWLQPGEIIVSHQVTVPTGITKDSDQLSADQKSVIVWLSGGTDCMSYDIACRITTNNGRTEERVGRVKVRLKR